jgi:hypothetical protein
MKKKINETKNQSNIMNVMYMYVRVRAFHVVLRGLVPSGILII